MEKEKVKVEAIKDLCNEFKKYNHIDPSLYEKFSVKRGLRNSDGTGVMAGLTLICNVHGYVINEGEKEPIPGELIYRGINIKDIVSNCQKEERFGFEETVYLLLFGVLPTKQQLDSFQEVMANLRHLPDDFAEDMIIKAPSPNVMNKLARSVLALYSYDDDAENLSLEKEIETSLSLISKMMNIMVMAYQVKKRHYDNETMFFHPLDDSHSTAQAILSLLRPDRSFTKEEALLLDLCLILHAEHGGGNNSTFACRVLSSSRTDAYSAYSGAIGSLKGPLHGGANIKVMEMVDNIKANVSDITNRDMVYDYLVKIINKQANDMSGKIYGMGHAVYTISDPRAEILRDNLKKNIPGTKFESDFILLNLIEELTPQIFATQKQNNKVISANVDLYSGLVYKFLGIPYDLFTPLFATSRMAGWSAHRIEELFTAGRIIRPAYKSVSKEQSYIPLEKRG
ncbi:MAG: citrate synthase [Oscillospiraceae bacterium]